MKKKTKVAIALGSNLGERESNIQSAIEHLKEGLLESIQISSLIETEPWGIKEQPKFLNGVVTGFTNENPVGILTFIKKLEKKLGRTKAIKNGPRIIDLDLICFGEENYESLELEVPHPRMAERDFVLIPLFEVWPDWIHPKLKKNVGQLLKMVNQIDYPLP